jgi:hypothetical protein
VDVDSRTVDRGPVWSSTSDPVRGVRQVVSASLLAVAVFGVAVLAEDDLRLVADLDPVDVDAPALGLQPADLLAVDDTATSASVVV